MSVGIGLKRCCFECNRPRLKLVELNKLLDRDVNVHCECSDVCHAYIMDEGDSVTVSNCDRDALLKVADTIEMQLNTSRSMLEHNEPEFVLKVWNDVIADSINAIRKACGVVE